jgi:hypothetical protein
MCVLFGWPKPSGPYAVGVTAWHFIDPLRADPFAAEVGSAGPGGLREVLAVVWYPAEAAGVAGKAGLGGTIGFPEGGVCYPRPPFTLLSRQAPLPQTLRRMVEHYRLPGAALSQVTHLASHAVPEAPPADSSAPWPVLLYSHGYGLENALSSSYQMEALASHGYVAVSVAHAGESLATVYADGRLVALDAANPRLDFDARLAEVSAAAGAWGPLAAQSLTLWAEDLDFVLKEIARHNARVVDNPLGALGGRLDLERVGAWGVGFGGSAAAVLCAREPRCKAAASLGGRLAPMMGSALPAPARPLLLASGDSEPDGGAGGQPVYMLKVGGARPLHFSGVAMWFPLLAQLADFEAGPVYRYQRAINAYLLAFFGQHLRGEAAPLLAGPTAAFPEVEISSSTRLG